MSLLKTARASDTLSVSLARGLACGRVFGMEEVPQISKKPPPFSSRGSPIGGPLCLSAGSAEKRLPRDAVKHEEAVSFLGRLIDVMSLIAMSAYRPFRYARGMCAWLGSVLTGSAATTPRAARARVACIRDSCIRGTPKKCAFNA